MAGLIGAGRTELARAVFGIDPILGGEIRLNGAPVAIRSAKDAIAHGIYLAPEDRKRSGLVLEDSVTENISLPDLLSFARYFLMNSAAERKNAERQRQSLNIKTADVETVVRHALGRQPAEGGPRQMAVDDAEGDDLRRADARH